MEGGFENCFFLLVVCCTQVLKAKQGASQQYGSQAERDAHLKKHIKQLKQAAAGQQDQLKTLQEQQQQLGSALNDLASVSATCAHTVCRFVFLCGSRVRCLCACIHEHRFRHHRRLLPARSFQVFCDMLSRTGELV